MAQMKRQQNLVNWTLEIETLRYLMDCFGFMLHFLFWISTHYILRQVVLALVAPPHSDVGAEPQMPRRFGPIPHLLDFPFPFGFHFQILVFMLFQLTVMTCIHLVEYLQ